MILSNFPTKTITPESIGAIPNPTSGTAGQVLTKTADGSACLDSVVSCGIVLDDVDFTQKIVDYVDSSDTNEAGVEEFRSFADIALSASVHI